MRAILASALVGSAVAFQPQRRHTTYRGAGVPDSPEINEKIAKLKAAAKAKSGANVGGPNTGGMWSTEHFDVRNTGSTTYIGPADAPGVCYKNLQKRRPWWLASDAQFHSTGVTTLSDTSGWFGGGDDNVLDITQIYSLQSQRVYPTNLTAFSPRAAISPHGIQDSGVDFAYDIGDTVVQPSADGNVYAVWWMSCMAQQDAHDRSPQAYKMHPYAAEREALEEVPPTPKAPGRSFDPALAAKVMRVNLQKLRDAAYVHKEAEADVTSFMLSSETLLGQARINATRAGRPSNLTDPFPPCIQWLAQLGAPALAPTRYVDYGSAIGGVPPFVLASESNEIIDTGGVLHAFDAATGAELWNFKAVDDSGKWWGLRGFVPAVDNTGLLGGAIFLAYGPRLVALSPIDGTVLGYLDTANATDPFVSSPVLDAAVENAFIHSVSGTLWQVKLLPTSTGPLGVNLFITWGCDYAIVQPNNTLSDCQKQPAQWTAKTFPGSKYMPDGRVLPDHDHPVKRSDFTNGGFYQPTTVAQRAELYNEILTAHARHTGKPDYATVEARAQAVKTLKAEQVAALAKEVPLDIIYSIVTPSGYRRLGSNGRAAPSRDVRGKIILGGTQPLATPAIDESLFGGDKSLVLPQWLPYERGDEGLFVVDAATGSVIWGWNSFITDSGVTINFGRSRSSPAIDGDDSIYVAADMDDPFYPSTTVPALWAFNGLIALLGLPPLVWVGQMGFEPNTTVGTASPIVIDGYDDGNYAIMSASDGVVQVGEGVACPTDDLAFECSGHGTCDCVYGRCTCDDVSCIGGSGCSDLCKNGGKCDSASDACICPPNYDVASQCVFCDPCHSGPDTGCQAVTNLCNYHGQCVVAGGLPTCQCDDGWGGMGCTEPIVKPVSTETVVDVGAAVGIPLALVGAAFVGYTFWKRRNPGKTFSDLMPSKLKGGYSFGSGVGFTTSSSSSSGDGSEPVVTQSALFATPKSSSEGSSLLKGKSYGAL